MRRSLRRKRALVPRPEGAKVRKPKAMVRVISPGSGSDLNLLPARHGDLRGGNSQMIKFGIFEAPSLGKSASLQTEVKHFDIGFTCHLSYQLSGKNPFSASTLPDDGSMIWQTSMTESNLTVKTPVFVRVWTDIAENLLRESGLFNTQAFFSTTRIFLYALTVMPRSRPAKPWER